jgi:TerC family integral membrane protein
VEDASARGETVAAAVGGAAVLGLALWALKGGDAASQYAAGYLLEQALSVDNLFVFVLVFRYFKVAPPAQDRVLAYGIASAAVLRLLMVAAGAELIEHFKPILLLFAGILVWSSYKLAFAGDGEDEEEDLSENKIVQLCSRLITVSPAFDGERFFTTSPSDPTTRVATPLLLVLAVIELSDVVFAVDSVPAVFGVTTDPVIVWAASMAAIASLRAMYGFVATVLGELRYLDKAVAAVLGWVGLKMIGEYVSGREFPTGASLGLIAAVLGVGIGASLWLPEEEKEA